MTSWDEEDEWDTCEHCGGIYAHSEGCPRACDCDTCTDDECGCECHDGDEEREA